MTSVAAPPEATTIKQRLFRTRAEDILPLDIQHKRIYILPTKRGLAYLFSLLIMLIASVNYALNLGYALCFLLTGLFAASLLHTYKNISGITCEKMHSENVFAGERAHFAITIKNKTRLERIGVTIKCADASDVIDVKPGETAQALLVKPTTSRGILKLGRITITSSYPLGLWRTWSYLHSNEHVTVYPAPEQHAPAPPTQEVDSQGEKVHKANLGDISGLREYNPGDSISSIAWKAAARGQGLFVKTFENENAGGRTHLTMAQTGLHNIEKQLSRLSAWVLAAEQSQTEYSLEVEGTHLELGLGTEQKQNALIALAQFGQTT